jgi:hypothetical protein
MWFACVKERANAVPYVGQHIFKLSMVGDVLGSVQNQRNFPNNTGSVDLRAQME